MNTDWDDYRHFAAVARLGTVRAAATALRVNPSTVTRRLERLEQHLGLPLFERSPLGLVMTAAGREVAAKVEQIARSVGELEAGIRAAISTESGSVTLQLPKSLGIVLAPRLDDFLALHPDIRIELVNPSGAPVSPRAGQGAGLGAGQGAGQGVDQGADITVRGTMHPDPDVIARPLGRPRMGVFQQSRPIEAQVRQGVESYPGWLSLHDSDLGAAVDTTLRHCGFADMPLRLQTSSILQQLAALRAGLGVGPLPWWMVNTASGLAEIPVSGPNLAQPFWLMSRPELRRVVRVQVLMEWLRVELAEPVYGFVRD